jgi:hypothetical protein
LGASGSADDNNQEDNQNDYTEGNQELHLALLPPHALPHLPSVALKCISLSERRDGEG